MNATTRELRAIIDGSAAPASTETGAAQDRRIRRLAGRSPLFYLSVFGAWALTLVWFHPRLVSLLDAATGPWTSASLLYFVIFTEIAWLYGIYNIAVVVFSSWLQRTGATDVPAVDAAATSDTPVAVLYTTCNDFVLESAESCLAMEYPDFTLYLLDDSSHPDYMRQVDEFAARHPQRTRVIRRIDRSGFKAGNLNHALARVVTEPLFVIADADEIMPTDFLSRLVPRIEATSRPTMPPSPNPTASSSGTWESAWTSTGSGTSRYATGSGS